VKPTPAQRKALENLAAGRGSDYGLRGASAHGGHSSVMASLRRRDWVEWVPDKGDRITKEGREVVKAPRRG
jgi:hypothetical protein